MNVRIEKVLKPRQEEVILTYTSSETILDGKSKENDKEFHEIHDVSVDCSC